MFFLGAAMARKRKQKLFRGLHLQVAAWSLHLRQAEEKLEHALALHANSIRAIKWRLAEFKEIKEEYKNVKSSSKSYWKNLRVS